MSVDTYNLIELAGESELGVDDAIKRAISNAGEKLLGLDHFEVSEITGLISEGKVGRVRVKLKVGFRILPESALSEGR